MKEKKKEIEKLEEEKKKSKKDPNQPDPDPLGKFGETFEVLKGEKNAYYNIMMTRADVSDGYYGTYLFYKMQVV